LREPVNDLEVSTRSEAPQAIADEQVDAWKFDTALEQIVG